MERELELKKEESKSKLEEETQADISEKPSPISKEKKEKDDSVWAFLKELIILVGTALVLAWVIKSFLIQPFFIPSSSMESTLKPNDRVLVNKVIYRIRPPQRQEIIVFSSPHEQNKDLIKRIIGIGGDTLEIKDGTIFINGNKVEEDYTVSDKDPTNYGPIKIPPNSFFMMGDNRPFSQDSRFFGVIAKDDIIGKAFIIYWPINRIRIIG